MGIIIRNKTFPKSGGIRKVAGVLLVLFTLLFLVSCPEPIDDTLIIEVQDEFQPSISVTSPADDSYYYSTIEIVGTITDSALTATDGAGELSSISYTVANDVSRQGKIVFASDRSYTKDDTFGTGDIIYDESTGDFNITFSTIEVDGVTSILQQRVTVTITAVDRNNNETTKTVRLLENDGPYINLVEPGTTLFYFSTGSLIEISGTVGNSYLDPDNADEIESIIWRVSNQAWNGSLDLTDGSSDFNGTIYTSDNVALQYSNPFTYNPSTRVFETSFDLPFGEFSVIPIEVRATDKNNHTSYATFNMYTNEAGPVMTFTLPATTAGIYNDGTDFYVKVASAPNISLAWTLDSDGPLATLGYSLPPAQSAFVNTLNLTSPAVIPGAAVSAGELLLTIRAVNNDSKESRYYFTVKGDDAPPAVTINSFYADTPGDYYAQPGNTIYLDFSIADAGPTDAVSGLPGSLTPAVSIKGSASLSPVSGYTYTYTLPADASVTTENLLLSVTGITDNVGNAGSADQTDAPVLIKYYSGAASLTGIGIVSNNANPTSWAKQGDTLTLTFTSPRDLLGSPTVTIAGNTPDSLTNTGNDYTATYVMTGTDTEIDIPYTIDFTDAAGNTGTPVSANSGIVYDRTDPVQPVVTISDGDGFINASENAGVSFTVSGEAGTTYTITSPNCTPGSATGTIPGGGVTSGLTLTADGDGVLSISVVLEDSAGNLSSAGTDSSVADLVLPATTATPGGGTFGSSQSIALAASETATIYYTTDGTDPTTGSSVYGGSITVNTDTTLKFFAEDSVGNQESIKTETYVIDTTPPVTTATPGGGTYGSSQSVSLAVNETATIYYTTDGTDPTTGSSVYSGSITVNADTTLKFFAEDSIGNQESIKTESYVIDTTAPSVLSVVLTESGGNSGVPESGDTIVFTFSEPIDATAIDGTLVNAGDSISDRLSVLVAYLGTFTTSAAETVPSTDSTLTLTSSTVITITLGTFTQDPSGDFTPSSANITDIAGNALDTTILTVASGDVSGSY